MTPGAIKSVKAVLEFGHRLMLSRNWKWRWQQANVALVFKIKKKKRSWVSFLFYFKIWLQLRRTKDKQKTFDFLMLNLPLLGCRRQSPLCRTILKPPRWKLEMRQTNDVPKLTQFVDLHFIKKKGGRDIQWPSLNLRNYSTSSLTRPVQADTNLTADDSL